MALEKAILTTPALIIRSKKTRVKSTRPRSLIQFLKLTLSTSKRSSRQTQKPTGIRKLPFGEFSNAGRFRFNELLQYFIGGRVVLALASQTIHF